jgi:alkanesulfonate monooxygenase SsuD/methylene tetrahydromethanopterin reductase-like flavin-dependent oxidoreductase (luciferase family)
VVPPIYFCVTGPRALERAGQMSDGVVLNAFMPPSYALASRRRLDAAAGGSFGGEIAAALVTAMAHSVSEAAARVRPILATYLVHFPDLARETGLAPDFLEHLRRLAAEEGLAATFPELPDELVGQHAILGPAEACRERLTAYREAGVQLPILFPDPASLERTIRELGPG